MVLHYCAHMCDVGSIPSNVTNRVKRKNNMENLNEIKKLLYKYKPKAKLDKNLSNDKTYVYNCDIGGLSALHYNKIVFYVPTSDMGDAKFGEEENAQLLIRWITNIV